MSSLPSPHGGPSYERILHGSQLKPSETDFFKARGTQETTTVIAEYHTAFPHSMRTDRAIENHIQTFRKLAPAKTPTRVTPALRSGGGQKSIKVNQLNLTLISSTGKVWVLKVQSVGVYYPLTETRTMTFPVSLAQLGDRDPLQQTTVLEVWKEVLLDTRPWIPDFEALWAAAGLARTPTKIAADTERLAAWQKAAPLSLIREIKLAFQDLIDRDPDAPVWNVKRLLEMGILNQIDVWVRAAETRIASLAGEAPPDPLPAAPPAPIPEQIGVRATVNDLILYASERDGGMWLVVDRDPPDPVTVTPRVQLYICAAKGLGADLFDPRVVLSIWVRKLKHAQKGVQAFEAAWVQGEAAASYGNLLPRQILPLLERSFLPKQVVTEEILPKVQDAGLPGEDRLFCDAARAIFEIGLYGSMDAAITAAEETLVRLQAERAAAEAAATAPAPVPPPAAPYPESFVADYGTVRVRYQVVEVIPAAGPPGPSL